MASSDIYLRKDVYEADQRAAKAESALQNNEVLKAIERLRVEMNGKFEEFKVEVNSRFDKLEAKVEVLSGRVDGLEKRMDGFERRMDGFERQIEAVDRHVERVEGYVGTGVAFIAMLVGVVIFIEPIARLVRKIFKPEPTITLEQIEALINSKLQPKQ